LAADGAEKIVEMLNADATASSLMLPVLTPEVASCVACHGKTGMANANGQMSCLTCHQVDDSHP
jgi:cytochrome c553